MTFRFAAARRNSLSGRLPRARVRQFASRAENDNDGGSQAPQILKAALVQFARHGAEAAAEARDKARKAHFTSDHEGYLHWLAVCRTLDRRMATALVGNLAKRRPPAAPKH